MMRRGALAALNFTLLLILAAAVAACGGAAQPSVSLVAATPTPAAVASTPTPLPEEQPTIGLVMKTLTNPFFVEMERGARRAERELGVKLIVRTGAQETSVEQQIAIVRDMIVQKADAIVIAPADSTELIPVLKQAQDIELVAMETANWKIDEGYDVIKQLMEQHPDVKLIFAANDMMAFGAIRYLQEQQRDDVLVAAYDALEEAKTALAEGTLAATVDQQAALQGYLGVENAVRILKGETMPVLTFVEIKLVTKATLEQ